MFTALNKIVAASRPAQAAKVATQPAVNHRHLAAGTFSGRVIGGMVALMLGGLAMAAEPSPATADVPMSLGQSITTLGQFFAGGVGLVLIRVIMSLRGVFAGQIDERIKAAKASDAEKKDGAMPQPFVTTRDNPPVGSREFATHRERNTAAHNEAFQAIRIAEEKLRGEIASGNATMLEKLETEIRELREADQHNSEKLSGEIGKLTMLVGELRGSVESLARREKIHR